ncbi:MAG: B12-binding domain-containing radical SAM protein [Pelagibacteraceae bacterium]|nr:B12-binding domain-containing radical SAM protein [Pelagibacteraceae bacterium]|tara:strand:- start:25342 stop:27036 length:1695 start_codon:yes stop_codon:yes gene_type:complete
MALKVVFIAYDNGHFDNEFPMGIGAIAAVLKKHGHHITIWNQDLHHYPDSSLTEYLDKNKFDVAIMSLIAGYYQYQKMKSLSKALNRSKNRPFYVMGGYGPTPEPEFFLKKSGCDAVGLGEGETTVAKLMEAVENKTSLRNVPGIAWLENGKLQQTPRAPLVHLDSLDWAPYELFDMKTYRMYRMEKGSPTDFCMPMMSARGCSFKCTFCYRMDAGYRSRSAENLLDECEMLYKDYGINYFAFEDDLLMSSVSHTESVCREFLKRNLPIKWKCNGRLNYCSEELLQLMKDAGCTFINYGIESMDQKVLNNMKKGLRPDMIVRGIEDTLKVGMSPGLNFIFGNKGDNKETIKKSVDFLLKYDDFAQTRTIRPVTPYPGSPLYYDAIEMGLLDKDNPAEDFYERKHLNSDLICTNFTELTDEEFYECLRWANSTLMKNYYNKQRDGVLDRINYLYETKDVTFRGFRFNGKIASVKKDTLKDKKDQSSIEGTKNWENNVTGDGDRFSQQPEINVNGNKNLDSFNNYLKRKEKRLADKKAELAAKKAAKEANFSINKPKSPESSQTVQ